MLAHISVSSGYASCSRNAVSSCQPPVRSYGSSLAGTRLSASHRRALASARKLQAAVPTRLIILVRSGSAADKAASRDDLPLWRHLREQEGFSQETISELQKSKGLGTQYTADKVQLDLAPNMAALRKEGLTTGTLKLIFLKRPDFLHTTHDTFTSSLPVLRDFAEQLDSNKLRPYDPPLTRLGAALRDYPGSCAYMLSHGGSHITASQQFLQDELGVSNAEFAAAVFKNHAILVWDTARAKRMVKHLVQVYNGDVKKVKCIALASTALSLEPAKFDSWAKMRADKLDITVEAVLELYVKQPNLALRFAGKSLDAVLDTIARLRQVAEGMPIDAPLQPQHLQAAKALVVKNANLQKTKADRVQGNWDFLRREGQAAAKIWAAFKTRPSLMWYKLEGPSQQLKAAWIKEELNMGFAEFITSYPSYTTHGVAKMAMRAHFLKARGEWDPILAAEGEGSLLSVLTTTPKRFCNRLRCTEEQLAGFERDWRRSPAALRWGGKSDRSRQAGPTDV